MSEVEKMDYHFCIHKEPGGYWGECIELEGCVSQGMSLDELKSNLKEALDLFLAEPEDSTVIFPLPKRRMVGSKVIALSPDPQIALAMLIRQERLKSRLTQKEVSEKLGVPLYSYQKLERAKTANPEWKTLVKLLRLFPRINLKFAV